MTLNECESFIDDLLNHNTAKNRMKVLTKMKNGILLDLIDSLLKSPKELEKIATQSYRHANGFNKIMLFDKRPKYALRLHLWDFNTKVDSHIHNHEWDLSGIVLYGSYRWKLYELSKKSSLKQQYEYECLYNQDYGGHQYVNEKYASTKKYFDVILNKGSQYTINGDIYHKITNFGKKEAASLVLHSDVSDHKISVISNAKLESKKIFYNEHFSIFELEKLLNKFKKKLKAK